MGRRQGQRRLLIAVAVSVLVHGLLLLAPARPPAPQPRPPALELEILWSEPPRVEAPAQGEGGGQGPDATDEIVEAAPEVPHRVEAPPGGELQHPPAEAPQRRAEDGVWREEALPDLDLAYHPKPPPAQESEGTQDVAPHSEGEAIEARIEGYFREQRAEAHARARTEPELVELRRRLQRRFAVPVEVLEDAPTKPNLGLGGAMAAYVAQAKRYGETGSPYEEDLFAPGAPTAPDTVASTVYRDGRTKETFGPPVSSTGASVTTLVARVEVSHGEAGLEATLLEGSGVPRFDRLALEQVREEAARVSIPERIRRTRWALVSTLRVTPPAPIVGCSIDQAFIPQECFYPGSKHQRSRVLLEAVYQD